jgi:hypothetical protein
MTRDEKIDLLVKQDFDYIMANNDSSQEMLYSILEYGFKGYFDLTDAELDAEIRERNFIAELE